MRKPIAIAGLLLLVSLAAHAQEPRPPGTNTSLQLMGGNHALQLRYLAPSGYSQVSNADLDYGFLLSENRDIVASSALMFHTDLHILPRLTIDVGPQGYLALLSDVRKTDVFAVALGADARYGIVPRWHVSLFGSAFYSPGVLTFGSADDLYDFTAGAQMRFTRRLAGMAGYRWLDFTTSGEPSVWVQNEVFVGLSWMMR
jgi:hypothetical protein